MAASSNAARRLGAPGIVVYALTITFASIDWVMSLEPDWYSTIYPGHVRRRPVAQRLRLRPDGAAAAGRSSALRRFLRPTHLRDFGSLLLTFVIFWAYMSFSQFLLDLGRQSAGRDPRGICAAAAAGWQYVVIVIAVCSLRRAVPVAAVARHQGASAASVGGGRRTVGHAVSRSVLVDRAGVQPRRANISSGSWTCRPGSAWADCVSGGSSVNCGAGRCCRSTIPTWRRLCAMSEPIQPTRPQPPPRVEPRNARRRVHESGFDFRLILSVGAAA